MVEGGGFDKKKKNRGRKSGGKKIRTGRSRRTPTHAVPTPVSSFSFLFFSGE